jgi:hypothetical protein
MAGYVEQKSFADTHSAVELESARAVFLAAFRESDSAVALD